MRKYRGKRIDDGKWVKGDKIKIGQRHFIAQHPTISTFSYGEIVKSIWGFVEVYPETIGQSTGLQDKEGKETYAGDKLQDSLGDVGTIYWKDNVAGFYCKWGDGSDMPINCGVAINKCEIIGTIHDSKSKVKDDI